MKASLHCFRQCGLLFVAILVASLIGALDLAAQESAQGKKPSEGRPFRSWVELRSEGVVHQRFDFSCGAASVATMATFFLGRPTSEKEALEIVRGRYNDDEWKKKKKDGLSMEDLAFIATQLGFESEGGRLGLAALLKLNGPVIIHLNKGEFQHFSVFRGVHGMTVYLADPILGKTGMSVGDFTDQFTGTVLAIWDPKKAVTKNHQLRLTEEGAIYSRLFDAVRPALNEQTKILGPRF